jgi:hypothetical protein
MVSADVATIVVGALALIGVLMSAWANVRVRRMTDRAAGELEELRVVLAEAKEIRAEGRSKQATAEATVSRYREPLLSAAFDLQARIYNMCRGRFFGADRSGYHVDHTLYVFGQYFGWREIIRQEIQFLDLGDTPATKDLAELLERITHSLSSSATGPSSPGDGSYPNTPPRSACSTGSCTTATPLSPTVTPTE